MINIGIDPGVKTGFAKIENGEIWVQTLNFYEVLSLLDTYKKQEIKVYIEVPENRHVWHAKGAAFNVGMAVREAELLAGEIKKRGIDTVLISPKQKGPKWDKKAFQKITGLKNQTNQHERDAIMLIWGRD